MLDMPAYRALAHARVPRGGWSKIEAAMGKTADHLARYLRLLLLPDEALDLADRNDLTEKHLRPVTEITDEPTQIRIVGLTVELELASAEVDWLCEQSDLDEAERILRARRASAGESAAPRAKFSPDQVLFTRVASLARLTRSVRKGVGDPAQVLANRYLAERGDAAEHELRDLIDVLQGALTAVTKSGSVTDTGPEKSENDEPVQTDDRDG